jgi:small subunit ribosomal protein S7
MRGKHKAKKRELIPDSKYNSVMVARFINKIMEDGKKTVATNIVYGALENLEQKTKKPALDAFDKVLNNVKPLIEVRSKRIGGATYQVPVEVPADRAEALATRWIIDAARNKKGKPMVEKLSEEIIADYNKEGSAMKKRTNVHKMAEANKAFAHFARF